MFGLEILDVVIGMIFVFLMLSLVCSAVNELIEAWLNKRAQYLERGIKELLNEKDGTGFIEEFYRHPLVAGLFRGTYGDKVEGWRAKMPAWLGVKKTFLPSYIPAQNFALALIDIIQNPSPVTSPPTPLTSPPAGSGKDDSKTLTIKALQVLIDAADGDPVKMKANIENWFNNSMDRVSGWYKRRTQIVILILGLVVAVGTNADSIAISNSLSHDKALRDSLVASAQEYAKNDASAPKPCADAADAAKCRFDDQMKRIENLGLPIGWKWDDPNLVPKSFGGLLLKIFGWLITAFAITLGAPFWFDLLNKFMVVRSTVKPKEKSGEDTSKD
jgi:hypothetical protein